MVLPLLKRDRNPLDQKLKSIDTQSNLIENSIKRLERNMRRNARLAGEAPAPPEPKRNASTAPTRRPNVSAREHTAEKLGKYLVTGSFQTVGSRAVPDRVRRNRRIFFIVLGVTLLIILFWFLIG